MEERSGEKVLVDVQDLAKHYGSVKAVDGISFQVHRGDVLGFLGPNGAGKTTAMKMITGFLEPDRGRASVCGFDVGTQSLEVRRRIGYLSENAPAYGEMTVDSFLAFVAEARELPDPARAAREVVGRTGLSTVVHQTIETLSKGFKRRVGLAQALIHDPEVLILDEPTDGLDPNQKAIVHELIGQLAENKALILSTHILDEVEQVCNRAMIVSQGRILEDATPAELIARAPRHNVLSLTLGGEAEDAPVERLIECLVEQPWCRRVERISEVSLDLYPEDGANHVAELLPLLEGHEIRELRVQEGRLEDLFRTVTQGVAA